MSGNQTSGKEGGVQCVMMVVCMYVCRYVCLISYVSDSEERLKLALPLQANCLVLCFLSYPSFSIITISLTKRLTKLLTKLLTK